MILARIFTKSGNYNGKRTTGVRVKIDDMPGITSWLDAHKKQAVDARLVPGLLRELASKVESALSAK